MAFWEDQDSQLRNSSKKSFMADSESDISSLPTDDTVAIGSDCLTIDTSDVYILDSTKTWVKLGG